MSTRPTEPPTSTSSGGRRLWLSETARNEHATGDDAFDALADLFLGEVSKPRRLNGLEAPAASEGEASARQSTIEAPADERPRLRLIAADEEELETSGEQAAGGDDPQPVPAPPAFIECVVLGNLPVLASAWASQYVREIAAASGRPVGSIRLQSGYATVEVVGDVHQPAVTSEDVEKAILAASRFTSRWVVRVDHAEEAAAAASPCVDMITLLTGVDEAARARAYSNIKLLAGKMPEASETVVRVALMAAAPEQAESAARTILDAVREHLGRDVQHAVCSAKIHATRPATMFFNGRTELSPVGLIDLLGRLVGEPGQVDARISPPAARPSVAAATERSTANAESGPSPGQEPRHAAPSLPVLPAMPVMQVSMATPEPMEPAHVRIETVVEPMVPAAAAASVAPVSTARPLVPVVTPVAIPPQSIDPPKTQHTDDVALWALGASQVSTTTRRSEVQAPPPPAAASKDVPAASVPLATHLAELKPLSLRCPYAAAVEFAIGTGGELHLLAAVAGEEDERALAALMVASQWTAAHAGLLAAALPEALCGHRPTLHLFTDRPKSSRRLLETDLRMHLLAPVRMGQQTAWYCTDLN